MLEAFLELCLKYTLRLHKMTGGSVVAQGRQVASKTSKKGLHTPTPNPSTGNNFHKNGVFSDEGKPGKGAPPSLTPTKVRKAQPDESYWSKAAI